MGRTMTAFKATRCGGCAKSIGKGQPFRWGSTRGQMLCLDCAGAPVVVTRKPADLSRATPEQLAAVEAAKRGERNIELHANAGTGKTTTLGYICRTLDRSLSIGLFVFNKRNRLEIEEKMGDIENLSIKTFHSAGFGALRAKLDEVQVKSSKCADILSDMVIRGEVGESEADAIGEAVLTLVSFAKAHLIGATTPDSWESWEHLINHYGIEFGSEKYQDAADMRDRAVEIASRILKVSNRNLEVIDFDDQLYLPVLLGLPMPQYDRVLIDEAQDTNPARRALARMSLKRDGRAIYVGDDRQAIYGFTGADADSMLRLRREFDAQVLPLTVNFRCGRQIIAMAKEFCPTIEAWDGASEGITGVLNGMSLEDFRPEDAVLSRLNAPLVTLAFKFIKVGRPFEMVGRDFLSGLIKYVQRTNGKKNQDLEFFLERLKAKEDREVARWRAKGENGQVQTVQDRAEAIRAVCDTLEGDERSVAGLLAALMVLQSHGVSEDEAAEKRQVTTLSSIHRSKGLEWDRVFVLNWSQMPCKWATKEWEKEQESNLQYVAITRARNELYFIESQDIA